MVHSSDIAVTHLVTLFRSGDSLRKISTSTGLSRKRVRQLVVDAGESIRRDRAVELPRDPSWWAQQFDAGWSVAELAARMGTNQMHVYRILRAIGVPSPRSRPLEGWVAARTTPDGECLRWVKSFSHGRPSATYAGSHSQSVRRILWEHTHCDVQAGCSRSC